MDHALVIDLAVLLVLVIGTVVGAKRGLFGSLVGLVIVIVSLVAATVVSPLLADPLTEVIYPIAEDRLIARLLPEQIDAVDGKTDGENAPKTPAPKAADLEGLIAQYREKLEQTVSGAAESVLEATMNTLRETARRWLATFVHALVFFVVFMALLLVLKLAARGLEHVFELPGLHALNTLGGGALGLIESTLLIFLLLYLAPRLGIDWIEEQEEGTRLLSFFLHNTPKSLINMLTR